ncbi:MAG: hypothetical protein Q4G68_11085 [Planctomycetia bacterium]|nr:hypothetical protein [Planctomycetia bacterium]
MQIYLLRPILTAAIVVCLFCAGSGCRGKPVVGTVSGTISLKGKPVSTGEVLFLKRDKSDCAVGSLGADGKYSLLEPITTGEYYVGVYPQIPLRLEPGEVRKIMNEFPVPEKFATPEDSGLIFTVSEGSNEANFEL